MALVDDWFDEFVVDHAARCCRNDMPSIEEDSGQAYWENWRSQFKIKGLTEEVATEASGLVAAMDLFPNQQLKAVLAESDRIFRSRHSQVSGAYSPGTREGAIAETPESCECGRCGIVARFRHEPIGDGKGHGAIGAAVACYCVCPMGRWTQSQHDPDTRRMFLDLASRPDLQAHPVEWSDRPENRHRYRPADWDSLNDRPVPHESPYLADSAALRRGERITRDLVKRPPESSVGFRAGTPDDLAKAEAAREIARRLFGTDAPKENRQQYENAVVSTGEIPTEIQ